jgi:hypothetical protein
MGKCVTTQLGGVVCKKLKTEGSNGKYRGFRSEMLDLSDGRDRRLFVFAVSLSKTGLRYEAVGGEFRIPPNSPIFTPC